MKPAGPPAAVRAFQKAQKAEWAKNAPKMRVHDLPPTKIAQIRFDYLAGVMTLAAIKQKHGITHNKLKVLIKAGSWVRGSRPPELQIDQQLAVYVGPVLPAEAEVIRREVAKFAQETLAQHKNVTQKALYVANIILDRLVASGGKKEVMVGKNEKGEPVIIRVDATGELLGVAKSLGFLIPLDRISSGLDANKGAGGENDEERRRREANDSFVTNVREEFDRRIAARMADGLSSQDGATTKNKAATPALARSNPA